MGAWTGIAGIIFWLLAVYLVIVGLGSPVGVPADPTIFPGGEMVNVHLLHVQAMNLQLGIGAAIIGTLFLCSSAVLSLLTKDPLD
jgi:hypothetical protein